jgi:hypothetical protein
MIRRWPYLYLVAVLLPTLFLAGCDQQSSEPFSVEVRVETQQGEPVRDASVGVRPCYTFGCELGGSSDATNSSDATKKTRQLKGAELTSFEVTVREGNTALLNWETKSETNLAGFEVQQKVEELDSQFRAIEFVEGEGTTNEPQSYEHETDVVPGRVNAFRLSAQDLDGSEYVISDTITVRPVPENGIRPIIPNPFSEELSLRLLVASPSLVIDSRIYTPDGSMLKTLVPGQTLTSGVHTFRWEVDDNTPDGLYEVRTEMRNAGDPVIQDTSYAAVISGPQNAFQIGTTSANGTVSTQERSRFPSLYDVPEFDVRDANGNLLGRAEVAREVQIVVATPSGRQTYRRSITDGKNTVTLTVSP